MAEILQLCAFLLFNVIFILQTSAIDLPYEVESTLLDLLAKKDLDHLDTSKRSIIPIYRKDLDPNYIAYYEIFVDKKHFFVLSSGPKTGDYREAESGPGPLPTDVLRDKARKVGQVCKKYFLLTSMGLYMCENMKGKAVAATYNWISDAQVETKSNARLKIDNDSSDIESYSVKDTDMVDKLYQLNMNEYHLMKSADVETFWI